MTGATRFTRAAGLAGLLPAPLAALGFVLLTAWLAASRDAPRGFREGPPTVLGYAIAIAVFGCTLVMFAGLLARHRTQWWAGVVVVLVLAAFLTSLTPAGDDAAEGLSTAAVVLLGYGIAQAGVLPRHAGWAFAAATVAAPVLRDSPLAPVPALVGLYAWLTLAVAMWREPLAEERSRAEAAA
ncbi:MAG TPA: hypothetical protein VGX28_09860 [Frankiaceae bacterium]|jgi:hypothetical protein|nr:hypothetical protein [Frankiaceae bacterium]